MFFFSFLLEKNDKKLILFLLFNTEVLRTTNWIYAMFLKPLKLKVYVDGCMWCTSYHHHHHRHHHFHSCWSSISIFENPRKHLLQYLYVTTNISNIDNPKLKEKKFFFKQIINEKLIIKNFLEDKKRKTQGWHVHHNICLFAILNCCFFFQKKRREEVGRDMGKEE